MARREAFRVAPPPGRRHKGDRGFETRMPGRGLRVRLTPTALLACALAIGVSYGVYAAVHRLVRDRRPVLQISGRLELPLYPGASQPVDPRLTNRYGFDVALMRMTVALSLDARHRTAGCSPSQDFRVRQLPARAYPILMRARSSATLDQLGVQRLPYLVMVDRDVDQAVCQGTKLKLRYRVLVRKLTARERAVLRRRGSPR